MIYVWESHSGRDSKPMLSVTDIVIAYSGNKQGTKLESALRGPMSKMLPATENLEIIAWVRKGAGKEEYDARIKGIFDERCVVCHNNRNPHLPSLEDFEGVGQVAQQDKGADVFTLVRVSHIHLFGLTFIFFMVGFIFSHSYFRREWLKCVILVIPFISIIIDITSWYLTKIFEPFAWAILLSGGVMGTSFAIQFFVSIYQMWFYKLPAEGERH
ncbi:MAG: hypothetical protein A2V90_09595 [Gammaproteobacteria bacterium RBG_16_57_12]|nr:MAG: hypothetical protein A2V90_09595 [Gammaproteobacteria bacterium RBG_16_57_12]